MPDVLQENKQSTKALNAKTAQQPAVNEPVSGAANEQKAQTVPNINVSSAVTYNKSKAISTDLWKVIQGKLNVPQTGISDAATANAVAIWQSDYGFTGGDVDGKLGPTTLKAMNLSLAEMVAGSGDTSVTVATGEGVAEDANVERAVQLAIGIANDDTHGYDQSNRDRGEDYDCSSLVTAAFRDAGFKGISITSTHYMKSMFTAAGFTWHDGASQSVLKRGDVLWKTGHTELYIGGGQTAGAHASETGGKYGETGDSTGSEIDVSTKTSFSNWEGYLRYTTTTPSAGSDFVTGGGTVTQATSTTTETGSGQVSGAVEATDQGQQAQNQAEEQTKPGAQQTTAITGMPTMSPLEKLMAEKGLQTNQQFINYCYNNSSDPYGFALSYGVNLNDCTKARKADIDVTAAQAVFANVNGCFEFFVSSLGLNNAGACGILGNIQQESSFNLNAVGDYGTSYGLCQWHNERKSALQSLSGYDTLPVQLAYLQSELQSGYAGTLSKIQKVANTAEGAAEAASYWCTEFEKPKDATSKAAKRGEYAKQYFETYGAVSLSAQPQDNVPAHEEQPTVTTEPEPTPEPVEQPKQEAEQNTSTEKTEDKKESAASSYVETTDAQLNAIQKQHPNGMTVAFYGGTKKDSLGYAGYENNTNNAEFTAQANNGAKLGQTVDLNLNMGNAIMANAYSSLKTLSTNLINTVKSRYDAAKPQNAPALPETLKIKNLSLYYHGWNEGLSMPSEKFRKSNVPDYVSTIRSGVSDAVNVQLFACSAAKGEGSFAETFAKELGNDAQVFGHNSKGHTTENADARVFNAQGVATNMVDVLFPEAWCKAEATRIWGGNYSDAAYKQLKSDLNSYYKTICGCGNWYSDQRKAFQELYPETKGVGGYSKISLTGLLMFSDTENMSGMLQNSWRHWALDHKQGSYASFGSLAASFSNLEAEAITAERVSGPAPAATENKAEEQQQITNEDRAQQLLKSAQLPSESTLITWYNNKNYSDDTIAKIREVVGSTNSGALNQADFDKIAYWQALQTVAGTYHDSIDAKFGTNSANTAHITLTTNVSTPAPAATPAPAGNGSYELLTFNSQTASWCTQHGFINSKSVDDLADSFRDGAQKVTSALSSYCSISSTLRHKMRAAVMHYACPAGSRNYSGAEAVFNEFGYTAKKADGSWIQNGLSAAASSFGIVGGAGLNSNHRDGEAIDFTLSSLPSSVDIDGKTVTLNGQGTDATSLAKRLHNGLKACAPELENKFRWYNAYNTGMNDYVHWSLTGH